MKLLLILSTASVLLAADTPTASKVFDRQLAQTEREVVPLVEAMPAEKINFAPPEGPDVAFKGVRTFAQEAKHIAFVINEVACAMLGEPAPPATATENGPDSITSKDEIVKYVKDAFAHAHQAMLALTNENLMEETADPFNPTKKRTRVDSASIVFWHTFDHYGQMVEYARMNNVIPPASR